MNEWLTVGGYEVRYTDTDDRYYILFDEKRLEVSEESLLKAVSELFRRCERGLV